MKRVLMSLCIGVALLSSGCCVSPCSAAGWTLSHVQDAMGFAMNIVSERAGCLLGCGN